MLPEPALIFTIASVHGGTPLDCRIYHPASLNPNPSSPPWRRHAAIMAHPYAPMGGCYDDPIVEAVTSRLLKNGFLVGTFNFRGAGTSAGRTSWTAKPERDDYASFVAFVVYYSHHLDPFNDWHVTNLNPSDHMDTGSAMRKTSPKDRSGQPILLLGGYSYGSMITAQLPVLADILETFASPEAASAAALIRIRAESLASRQSVLLRSARAAILEHRKHGSTTHHGLRVGGDDAGSSPRKSFEYSERRSFSMDMEEKLRKGMEDILHATRHPRHPHKPTTTAGTQNTQRHTESTTPPGRLPTVDGLTIPRPAYLLVSPLQGLVGHLASMSLVPSAWARAKSSAEEAAEGKLTSSPTLAIYGDSDVFTPKQRLQSWVQERQEVPNSSFRGEEIASAGHFWVEEGVLSQMIKLVDDFSRGLLETGTQGTT